MKIKRHLIRKDYRHETSTIFLRNLLVASITFGLICVGCNRKALHYKNYDLGISFEQLSASSPNIQKSQQLKDESGDVLDIYRDNRPNDDTRAIYMVNSKDNHVKVIDIIFGKTRSFDEVLQELKSSNGDPTDQGEVMGFTSVVWNRGKQAMTLVKFGREGSVDKNGVKIDTIEPTEFSLGIQDATNMPSEESRNKDLIAVNTMQACTSPSDCVITECVCMYCAVNKNNLSQFAEWVKKEKGRSNCQDQFVAGAQADCKNNQCVTVYHD